MLTNLFLCLRSNKLKTMIVLIFSLLYIGREKIQKEFLKLLIK